MCRTLPAPLRLAMAKAAEESAYITPLLSAQVSEHASDPQQLGGTLHHGVKLSLSGAQSHMVLGARPPFDEVAAYIRAPPPVDLPVFLHPAQSESE